MHDLAAIIARLAVSTTRLLTLVGAPGVGKTRLSIEVAHAASPLFPDGVVFVPLADISDPHQVIDAIHRAVQSISGGDPKSPRTLSDLVGAKQMLIILDTFEHLIAAAPHITALLTTTERCVILATSRQSLQVYGEHLYPLDPLPVPAVTVAESVEPLMAFPAIQLFTERVQAYSPAWQLNSENAPTVVKLCQSMDGLPLGIEILASLTKGHSLRWILDQGQPYLLQARSVWQDRTLRQQSLHGALTWSWGLLTPAEQEVFCLFGHFAEPCSLRSMAAFSRGMGGPWPNLESLVESLVEKHLVLRWTQESGHPVYMMLSTLRVYAQLRGLEHNQAIWSPRSVEEAGCDQHTAHRHRMSSQRVLVTSAMASPARSE